MKLVKCKAKLYHIVITVLKSNKTNRRNIQRLKPIHDGKIILYYSLNLFRFHKLQYSLHLTVRIV
jgi:hypothetical protein